MERRRTRLAILFELDFELAQLLFEVDHGFEAALLVLLFQLREPGLFLSDRVLELHLFQENGRDEVVLLDEEPARPHW